MGAHCAPYAPAQSDRTAPPLEFARDPGWHLLPGPHRLCLAATAPGLPAVQNRLRLLPPLEERRHLGEHPRLSPRETAERRGAGADAQRGSDGQPVRQDHGKGGPPGRREIGYDGHKKVNGRKRHILVDTQGLLISIKVTAANVAEQAGARLLLEPLKGALPRMQLVWADQGYTGDLSEWVTDKLGWRLEVVERTTQKEHHAQVVATAKARLAAGATVFEAWSGLKYGRGVEVVARRWVVERTFSWLGKSRRLSKDYEYLPESSEAMAFLAMTRLMLKRLGRGGKTGSKPGG
jgi:transposase